MFGPGEYVPDPTEGIVDVNDLHCIRHAGARHDSEALLQCRHPEGFCLRSAFCPSGLHKRAVVPDDSGIAEQASGADGRQRRFFGSSSLSSLSPAAHRQRSASALQTMKTSCRLCAMQHSRRDGTTSFWDSEVC